MTEEYQNDSCEEPDANFFDTFFDDGFAETIGEVLGNKKSDEDSSCELVEIISENTVVRNDECKRRTSLKSSSQDNSHHDNLNREKVVVLKPAHFRDEKSSTKIEKLNNAAALKSTASADTLTDVSDCWSGATIHCKDSEHTLVGSQDVVVHENKTDCEKLPLKTLLSKVQKFLSDTPAKRNEEKVNEDQNTNVTVSLKSCQFSGKKEAEVNPQVKTKEVVEPSLSYEARENVSSTSGSTVNKVYAHKEEFELESKPPAEFAKVLIPREKGSKSDSKNDSLGSCEASRCGVKRTSEDYETSPLPKISAQGDTEKENDLTLEETCPNKKQQQSPPGKKISLNLKTQILASTTIFNSESPEKVNQCSSSSSDKKRKERTASPLTLKFRESSPISNKDGNISKHNTKKVQDRGMKNGSISPNQERHRYPSRERRQKKKKKREGSPKTSRKDRDVRKLRSKHKRSRSRSPSPLHHDSRYSSWKKTKRDWSPDDTRRKRWRSSSKSPSLPSSRRYVRRSSRSPFRHRSRSRSYSPEQRFRQSPSPTVRRRSPSLTVRRRSPSPTVRRRRSSRSKSRSPFINEICRLKKQWDKEDEEKRSSSLYMQNHSGRGPVHLPPMQTWSQEIGCSSTIVSNMMSVQVHSTSFTLDNLSQPCGPGNFSGPHMQSDIRPYGAIPPMPPPAVMLPSVPGAEALMPYCSSNMLNRSQCDSVMLPPFCVPPPLPAPPLTDVNRHQTSLLRKQLDILKSTVISLPESCSSSAKFKTKNVGTRNQSSIQSHTKPAITHEDSPHPKNSQQVDQKTKNQSTDSNVFDLGNRAASSSEENAEGCSHDVGATTAPSTVTSLVTSLVDTVPPTRTPDSGNVENNVSALSDKPLELPPSNITSQEGCNSSNDSTCTPTTSEKKLDNPITMIKSNKPNHDSEPLADPSLTAIVAIQAQITENQCSDPQVEQKHNGKDEGEEDDSDCIIEELPPKKPVELICLSEDEVEDERRDDIEICVQDDLNDEFDFINMGLDPSYESTQVNTKKVVRPTSSCTPKKSSAKRKRTRKKKTRREKNLTAPASRIDSCTAVSENGSTIYELRQANESTEDTSEDSYDSILKECREMIDSLRIGRFVVVDEDPSSHLLAHAGKEESTSIICQSSNVEFSFTKKPSLKEVSQSKDASTNTPIPLCIDVCTETESSVILKHCMTQTDLCCRQCSEKETLIKEMNDQLLCLKKERDDLYAIICSLKETPKIPGLDFTLRDVETSKQTNEGHMSTTCESFQVATVVSNKATKAFNDVQSTTNSWPHAPHRSLIAIKSSNIGVKKSFERDGTNLFSSPTESEERETVLSYEYNHSLPN